VFEHVARLEAYPAWLPLVHAADVDPTGDDRQPAWAVELRARVGPFARSKQLRMVRTECETDRLVVFERSETDGRLHASWVLRAELEPSDGPTTYSDRSTRVTMHLSYDGRLWTAGLLEGVLDEEIRRGRAGLAALVSDAPTR
jgi:hypothetical protein